MSDPFEGLFDSGEVLERVGVNLTTQARRGDLEPVRCRDAEIARVVDILLRQSKNNPALIGKAGVGKTAIVEGLAQRVAAGDVPPALKEVRVVALDHVALLAGTTFRGQYEERIRKLVRELSADPDLILFVDELHNLIGQGTALGAAMDAANMLKPALVRGDIRIIGATTGGEYDKWIRGDPALERRFPPGGGGGGGAGPKGGGVVGGGAGPPRAHAGGTPRRGAAGAATPPHPLRPLPDPRGPPRRARPTAPGRAGAPGDRRAGSGYCPRRRGVGRQEHRVAGMRRLASAGVVLAAGAAAFQGCRDRAEAVQRQ